MSRPLQLKTWRADISRNTCKSIRITMTALSMAIPWVGTICAHTKNGNWFEWVSSWSRWSCNVLRSTPRVLSCQRSYYALRLPKKAGALNRSLEIVPFQGTPRKEVRTTTWLADDGRMRQELWVSGLFVNVVSGVDGTQSQPHPLALILFAEECDASQN